MGDFNARTGNETIPEIQQGFNEIISNNNEERMVDFCTTNILRITFFTFFFTLTPSVIISLNTSTVLKIQDDKGQ